MSGLFTSFESIMDVLRIRHTTKVLILMIAIVAVAYPFQGKRRLSRLNVQSGKSLGQKLSQRATSIPAGCDPCSWNGGSNLAPDRRNEAMSQDAEKQSMPLTWILVALGRDYDCFFTIENGTAKGESGNWLEAKWTERTLEKGGLVHELEQLRQSVPNFSYEFDFVNSRIVHIIDARLKEQRGYALERTIKSLDFSGRAHDLPNEIGKQEIPIATPTGFSTHEPSDYSTVVQVKGEALTVRGALSNFVKLEGRERILWIARTKLKQGATSYVFYPWPGRVAKQ